MERDKSRFSTSARPVVFVVSHGMDTYVSFAWFNLMIKLK